MGFVDIAIPLAIGLLAFLAPDLVVKPGMPNYQKKRATVKKVGLLLIGVAMLFIVIKFYGR